MNDDYHQQSLSEFMLDFAGVFLKASLVGYMIIFVLIGIVVMMK